MTKTKPKKEVVTSRPKKFWRAKWTTRLPFGWDFNSNQNCTWYSAGLGWIKISDHVLVCGPICTTNEMAEQLAEKRRGEIFSEFARLGLPNPPIEHEPIEVDEKGSPL